MKNRTSLLLIPVALGTFMSALDASVVNVAAPVIKGYFGVSMSTVQWVITAYLIVVSSELLFFGRLSDMYGQKRVYVTGFGLFIVGSALCGLSASAEMLIGMRVFQAIGAGMMFSTNNAIVTHNVPAERRGRAFSVISMAVAIALSTGPVLGGALTGILGWQSIFYINIPVGIVGITLAIKLIPADKKSPSASLDIPGSILIFAALFMILLPLDQLGEGMNTYLAAGMILAGVTSAVLFVIREKRTRHPLMPLTLFQNRVFSAGLGASALNFMAQSIMVFLVPFYLQNLRLYSTAMSGLLYVPMPLTMLLIAPAAGYISDRFDTRFLSSAGMGVMAVGLFMLSFLNITTPLWYIVVSMIVTGLGSGMFQTPNNSAVMNHAPKEIRGVASGMLATARNMGMVIGVALSGALFSLFSAIANNTYTTQGLTGKALSDTSFAYGLHMTFVIASIVAICAMAASLTKGKVKTAGMLDKGE